MQKLIACCGYNCAACEARIATMANDPDLRAKKAQQWNAQFNRTDITPEMINCTGCLAPGLKIGHCLRCTIRKCAMSKSFTTCGECGIMESCTMLEKVIKHVPEAMGNLKSLRKAKEKT
jgi:hypothetical protein